MTHKDLAFLSFGHWHPRTPTPDAAATLQQSIDLSVAAEEMGLDGAFFRVHHFARQLPAPFPLLAAVAAKTATIALGTAVTDLRYENPMYMAEEAAIVDLISGGRLQLGLSRGSQEPAWRGAAAFGYETEPGETDERVTNEKLESFLSAISGSGVVAADASGRRSSVMLPVQPQSPGLRDRVWWGSASRASAARAGMLGLNLMSSTVLHENTGVSFDELQAEQISAYREAWNLAGWDREPRVTVVRSVLPVTSAEDAALFGRSDADQVGILDNRVSRFGRTFTGEPDQIAKELREDKAVDAADMILLTVPNQLGVAKNVAILETILTDVAPQTGWR